jgi:Ion channel
MFWTSSLILVKCDTLAGEMIQIHRIAILVPLLVGLVVGTCALMIHALPLSASVNLIRRERRLGRVGRNVWTDMEIVGRVLLYSSLAHILEIALWGVLFMVCGEFRDFGTAFYHSAVNYTTLGYGDLIMTPAWRLLGPLEAANGVLLFGVTTAMVITILQRLIEARFMDLKD